MAYLKAALAFMFASGLVMYPEACAAAARGAMNTWATAVAPALFPFAAVMPFITCDEARYVYNRIFGRITGSLFGLPGAAASAIVAGMLSGSPAGALAVARVAEAEGLTKGQTARLAGIACGVSPVYLISVLGVSLNGSAIMGWRLAGAQLAAQVVAGIMLRKLNGGGEEVGACVNNMNTDRPVAAAVNAALRVCGYMVLFSVGIKLGEMALGQGLLRVAAFIDLPSGAGYCNDGVVLAAAAGFGGVCICAQNMAVLRGMVNVWVYAAYKVLTAVLCAGAYMVVSGQDAGMNPADMMREGMVFEKNLLLTTVFILPIILFFVRKRPKKLFS